MVGGGGVVASNVFLQREAPGYGMGYGVSLGLVWVCGVSCAALLVGARWENGRRDRYMRIIFMVKLPVVGNKLTVARCRGERDWRVDEGQEDRDNLGDGHP